MAHERETVVLSPAAAACPPSGALLAHSKRPAWLVACFTEVESKLFINLHAQTSVDSCSVEVVQKKIIRNRWAHLNLNGHRGGNSGNRVTVSVLIGLSTNPCCSVGQSKHRLSVYISAVRRLSWVYSMHSVSMKKKKQSVKGTRFSIPAGYIFLIVVFAACMILHNTIFFFYIIQYESLFMLVYIRTLSFFSPILGHTCPQSPQLMLCLFFFYNLSSVIKSCNFICNELRSTSINQSLC